MTPRIAIQGRASAGRALGALAAALLVAAGGAAPAAGSRERRRTSPDSAVVATGNDNPIDVEARDGAITEASTDKITLCRPTDCAGTSLCAAGVFYDKAECPYPDGNGECTPGEQCPVGVECTCDGITPCTTDSCDLGPTSAADYYVSRKGNFLPLGVFQEQTWDVCLHTGVAPDGEYYAVACGVVDECENCNLNFKQGDIFCNAYHTRGPTTGSDESPYIEAALVCGCGDDEFNPGLPPCKYKPDSDKDPSPQHCPFSCDADAGATDLCTQLDLDWWEGTSSSSLGFGNLFTFFPAPAGSKLKITHDGDTKKTIVE